jgi:hypothetical protein
MKSILLLWLVLCPLLSVGQARTRKATDRIPVGDYSSSMMQRLDGANELLLVTPDSLAQALQKMQQFVERKGYQVAERTATMLTTKSKYVQAVPGEAVLVRKWFFFQQWKPAPNPPVSFRVRVRAFSLPTGTQLQLVGVYIHEGCAECIEEACPGQGMQHTVERANRHPYVAPGHRAPPVPFGTMWAENCYEEALDLARAYQPSTLYFVQVHRYTTSGAPAW